MQRCNAFLSVIWTVRTGSPVVEQLNDMSVSSSVTMCCYNVESVLTSPSVLYRSEGLDCDDGPDKYQPKPNCHHDRSNTVGISMKRKTNWQQGTTLLYSPEELLRQKVGPTLKCSQTSFRDCCSQDWTELKNCGKICEDLAIPFSFNHSSTASEVL